VSIWGRTISPPASPDRSCALACSSVGSIFSTATKAGFELVGPGLLRELRPEMRVPLIAIGGITAANVGEAIRAGADGVAVISAVCGVPDPEAASRRLLDAIRNARAS